MKKILWIFCIVSLVLTACGSSLDEESYVVNEGNRPEKLIVFISGYPHSFQNQDVSFDLFPSKATVGMKLVHGEVEAFDNNVFAQALQDYEKESGIPIEIHYIEDSNESIEDLLEKGEGPDMMILGKDLWYDYYRLAERDILLDFSAYMRSDEALSSDDLYYQKVIQGGDLLDGQFLLPILFNVNAFISTNSFMQQIGMEGLGYSDLTYEDVLFLFTRASEMLQTDKEKESLYERSGYTQDGLYLASILSAAAYPSYFDNHNQNLLLSAENVADVLDVMEAFYEQEFVEDYNWEQKTFDENLVNFVQQPKTLDLWEMEEYVENSLGIFLSGGRGGGWNWHNSLLSDAMYFHSAYMEEEEGMILCGIPTLTSPNTYAANITDMVVGFQDTKYPEAVYDLARYLMDYQFPFYYGFSINREITAQQMEEVQTTELALFSGPLFEMLTTDQISLKDAEIRREFIHPLDSESVQTIENILNHIEGAGVPYYIVESTLYSEAIKAVFNGEMTSQEAAEHLITSLNEYMRNQKEMGAFERFWIYS